MGTMLLQRYYDLGIKALKGQDCWSEAAGLISSWHLHLSEKFN